MTGFLIINHFLKGKKFDTLHRHLADAASKSEINLIIRTNLEAIFDKSEPDFVLFWDKDINLAAAFEKRGIPVFNSARAIALCDDKAKTYLALQGIVPQPKTIVAPLSFSESDYTDFVHIAADELGMPVVFKECCGSFGEQVHLCRSEDEVLCHIKDKPFLLQEYIDCDSTDVRLEIVDGKCVAAMKRHNDNDFRSNITNGATAIAYTPSNAEIELAIKACDALGLMFGGVDILDGRFVCEVNSNAHIINLMQCTGIDIAPFIFDMIRKKL